MRGLGAAFLGAVSVLAFPGLSLAQEGLSPIIGGLPFDSGLAGGLQYRQPLLSGERMEFSARAIGSVKKYLLLETGLSLPRIAGGKLFAETRARYRNYPEEDFWGLGPNSSKDRRTSFRLEDFDWLGSFGVRAKRWFEAGVLGGVLATNTGPGQDRDWPSIEQGFTPESAPGLDRQPGYLYAGVFMRADYRNEKSDPRRGGLYEFQWIAFHDRDFDRYHFRRYRVELRQFFTLAGKRDTVAARALLLATQKQAGQSAPFFMLPTVGGGNDLRGYRQYRFRDENALVLNLEYRWRIREIIQAVWFADAGRVASRPGQLAVSGMRGSVGLGGRFKLGERIVFGLDLGWSPEGLRLWFRTGHAF